MQVEFRHYQAFNGNQVELTITHVDGTKVYDGLGPTLSDALHDLAEAIEDRE